MSEHEAAAPGEGAEEIVEAEIVETGETPADAAIPAPAAPAAPVSSAAPPAAPAAPAAPAGPAASAAAASAAQGAIPQPVAGSAFVPPSAASGAATPPPFSRPAAEVAAPAQRRRIWGPVLAGVAIGAVLGGVSGAGAAYLVQRDGGGPGAPLSGPQTITVNDYDDTTLVSAVAAKAMPSVVTISVAGSTASGTGSGVVLDDAGHILTNNHVVTLGGLEADPTVRITTSSGRVFDAEIVGVDPLMDLAVIQAEDTDGLEPIEFADSSELNVGDITIAIGAPLGLAGTVTSGIISSLDRSIEVASSAVPDAEAPQPSPSSPFEFFRFDLPNTPQAQPSAGSVQLAVIQTDTAINSGNSGGALLDGEGRLIGINVAIATGGNGSKGNIGVGFAIPSNIAARIGAELIEHGAATHGLLGVSVANVLDDPAQADADVIGASIVEVVPGGAGDEAGLRVGDIIIGIDGVPVKNKTDITAQVRTHAAGAEVEIDYVRGDGTHTARVTLGNLDELLG